MKIKPKVSVLVSTYKSERFIEGCLQSIASQTLCQRGFVEIIIIDANSPENERMVAEEFAERFPQIPLIYHRTTERIGLYAAWNLAIRMASGQYITNANTDDRHAPGCFERIATSLPHQTSLGVNSFPPQDAKTSMYTLPSMR